MFIATETLYNEKDVAMRIFTFVFPDQPAQIGLCINGIIFLIFKYRKQICAHEEKFVCQEPCSVLTGAMKYCIHQHVPQKRFRESLCWFSRGSLLNYVIGTLKNRHHCLEMVFSLLNMHKVSQTERHDLREFSGYVQSCQGLCLQTQWSAMALTSASTLQSYMKPSCPGEC